MDFKFKKFTLHFQIMLNEYTQMTINEAETKNIGHFSDIVPCVTSHLFLANFFILIEIFIVFHLSYIRFPSYALIYL